MKIRTIIRTIIIILVLVCTVFAGRLYIKRDYVNKLDSTYKMLSRIDLLQDLINYDYEYCRGNYNYLGNYGYYKNYRDNYGHYINHTERRDYYRKIVKELKTDKLIVDFINTILPYYDLTYENSKAEFEARSLEIRDITNAYKAKLSLNDRLKIVEFQVKAIKEK